MPIECGGPMYVINNMECPGVDFKLIYGLLDYTSQTEGYATFGFGYFIMENKTMHY